MKKLALYIHIPFCAQKCLYCDFASFSGKGYLRKDYIECLCKEINDAHKELDNYVIETIFIGGGTPSILVVDEMKKLLGTIRNLNLSKNIEYSMECNPGSLNEHKLKVMKEYGVNRISMGLQAVQDGLLKTLGRVHNFEEFKENFLTARKCGFHNINVDLMFGLPNQTLEQWKESLNYISDLKPEHISAYSLIIEEGTPFYDFYEKDIIELPTEDIERDMYNSTLEILKNKGYNQYEISNFSLEDKECRHNLAYWGMKEWIGLGSGASSFINNKRIKNVDSIEEYIEKIKNNEKPYEEIIENSKEDTMEEFMFMGLRKLGGIDESEFEKRFSQPLDAVYKNVINKYLEQGLLKRDKGKLYLSKEGIEVSNQVMAEFLLS